MSSSHKDISKLLRKAGIGLTGGIATGKSTVGQILRNLGYLVVDADKLAREVVRPHSRGLALIVAEFGGQILHENGELKRKKLAQIIFNDSEAKAKLERIVHPLIHQRLAQILEEANLWDHPSYWFYEAALLYETGFASKFNQIWVVHCPLEMQLSRIVSRDQVSMEHAQKILDSQISNKKKAKMANVVIDTSTSLAELEAKIRVALEYLPKLSRSDVY